MVVLDRAHSSRLHPTTTCASFTEKPSRLIDRHKRQSAVYTIMGVIPRFVAAWLRLALLLTLIPMAAAGAGQHWKDCHARFMKNDTTKRLYGFHGPVHSQSIAPGTPLLSVDGCKALCGKGSNYHDWQTSASTITTWVLPMVGLLLQAPFESNAKKRTFLAIIRWLGSPIASLSYILWNVRVTAKSSLIVDMCVPYHEFPDADSDFAEIRDSFGILSFMNQYSFDPTCDTGAGEKLIRVALFSNEMKMTDGGPSLAQRRRTLADSLRSARRKGVVPLYITLMWFVFALAISLADAFGPRNIGSNTLAHDLAMGLLMSWVPVIILSGIVDRNPSAVEDTRRRLNELLAVTRNALLDPYNTETIVVQGGGWREHYPWLDQIESDDRFDDFFHEFAGQGRVRMHYGIADPILSNIEFSYVGQHGRNWLEHDRDARWALVYGYVNPKGLFHFDLRQLWQILSSILIIDGIIAGAFVISFLTPTVGLGCRSGGYMIFQVFTGALLTTELMVWWATHRTSPIRAAFNWVLTVGELVSTSWLIYIIMAQIVGSYQSCACKGSTWAGKGGYIDLGTSEVYKSPEVKKYWGAGTALSVTIMGGAFAFIIAEWCEQSHLFTQKYSDAMSGLRRTRRWKRLTLPFRHIPDRVIELIKWTIRHHQRRSMIWTVHSRPQRQRLLRQPSRTSSRRPLETFDDGSSFVLSPVTSPDPSYESSRSLSLSRSSTLSPDDAYTHPSYPFPTPALATFR